MKLYLIPILSVSLLSLSNTSNAQCCCDYRVVCQTIYHQQPMTAYRLVYETQFEEQRVVTQRPIWHTETRVRRIRVARPVTETNTREQRYQVKRPVWETQEQERQYTVRRPVVETVMQDRTFTTYEPVTTMRAQQVDMGQFVNQPNHTPGPVRRRLRWRGKQHYTDPNTGAQRWQRAGLYWVPTHGKGTTTVTRVWVPNVVTQQIPQTTYQAKQVVQKVPVKITTYKDEVVTQRIPVRTMRWQVEEVVQQIPVTTTRYEYEERDQQIPVRVCKMVAEEKTVLVPRCVAKWVPVTYSCMRPRTVVMRVPLDSEVVVNHEVPTTKDHVQPADEGSSPENGLPVAPTDTEQPSDHSQDGSGSAPSETEDTPREEPIREA